MARNCFLTRILALLIAMFALSCEFSLASASENECWYLKQRSAGAGDHEIYLSERAIRIKSLSTGILTISRAPDWKIERFNSQKHVQFNCDFKSWRMREMSEFLNDFFGKWQTWKHFESDKLVAGQPVSCYEWKSPHKKPPVSKPSSRTLIAMYEVVEDNKLHQFWVWNRPGFKRQAEILSTLYSMPDPPGIVLQNDLSLFSLGGTYHIVLTDEFKRIDAPKGIFEKPDGYKLTTNYSEFLLSPQNEVFMQLFGE